ncbi:MAG: hypothetical protein KME49_26765 [Brasilonema octagenarum HA4186-MV1]|jgi:hypothetical protein|nr:hypothetical protein [Brasilonema octagenarum HA4186-MV1]
MNGTSEKKVTAIDELLAAALVGKSEEFKKRVWDYVGKSGLAPDDPLFLVLVATGRLEVLLEDAPDTLEQLFKNWSKEISRNLELVESATIERQKLAIARAVADLIKKAEQQEAQRLFTSIVPATGLVLAILGLGIILGMSIPPWLEGGLSEPQRLTINQLEALRWAESNEGEFARNLMKWNAGYLDNFECQKDAQSLKVTLTQGNRKASSGFCILWTVPPNERKFVN